MTFWPRRSRSCRRWGPFYSVVYACHWSEPTRPWHYCNRSCKHNIPYPMGIGRRVCGQITKERKPSSIALFPGLWGAFRSNRMRMKWYWARVGLPGQSRSLSVSAQRDFKSWSESGFSIAETTWPTYLYIRYFHAKRPHIPTKPTPTKAHNAPKRQYITILISRDTNTAKSPQYSSITRKYVRHASKSPQYCNNINLH